MRESPFAALHFGAFRRANREQVSDGGRKDVIVALKVIIVLGETTERLRDVGRHRRLFRDDERFSHLYDIGHFGLPDNNFSLTGSISRGTRCQIAP
jgi:hypothetical protein